ncbi:MAG: VOC family protein [Propionibacteriaceae bacterium]|nr:VOC family protein [Propionibacteriaceae bacterium]
MHLDHLTFAAGPEGLLAATEKLEALLGARFRDGGFHPRFGTRNRILPLKDGRWLEVIEALDHPAAEKAPFGQAVRARSAEGGGWMGWAVSVDDISPLEERLERRSGEGSRQFPDGRWLQWRQIGVRGFISDPQLPFFIKWESEPEVLPSSLKGEIKLVEINIAGAPSRVESWLGESIGNDFDGVKLNFTSQHGHPGIAFAVFDTPSGFVQV